MHRVPKLRDDNLLILDLGEDYQPRLGIPVSADLISGLSLEEDPDGLVKAVSVIKRFLDKYEVVPH